MNTISGEFRQEIEDIWSEQIADDPAVKAVVFVSGKPDNYIAGADIKMISATKDKADLKKARDDADRLCLLCVGFAGSWEGNS